MEGFNLLSYRRRGKLLQLLIQVSAKIVNCLVIVSMEDTDALAKLSELRKKSFRDQAIFILDSSDAGNDIEKCNTVRNMMQQCGDAHLKGDEIVLDDFTAHRMLEASNTPCTSTELRAFMESIHGKNSRAKISLAELLMIHFGYDWRELISSLGCLFAEEKRAREELDVAKAELNRLTESAQNAARAAEAAHQAEVR